MVHNKARVGWEKIIVWHITSYHIISSHIMSYHIISCHVISYHFISCDIISSINRHPLWKQTLNSKFTSCTWAMLSRYLCSMMLIKPVGALVPRCKLQVISLPFVTHNQGLAQLVSRKSFSPMWSGYLFLLPEHLCCCRFRDSVSVVVRTFPTIKKETKLITTCQTRVNILSISIPRILTQPNLTPRTKMLLSRFCGPRVSTSVAIQHAHRPTIDGLCTIVWTNECD